MTIGRINLCEPPPKLNSDESDVLSIFYSQSMENEPNEVISKMVLTHLLKSWDENKTRSHPSSIAMTLAEHIFLKVCCIILKYCHIQTNFPVNFCMSLFPSSTFQTDESNLSIIINKYQLYVMESHVK